MAFSGEGALGVWHGVEPGFEAEVEHWYNREHHQERVVIDGFLRARRYKYQTDSGPRYFSRYDADSVVVLGSDGYLHALRNPSPWSQKIFTHYRDTVRGAFRVLDRWSIGTGGFVLSVRLPVGDDSVAEDVMAEMKTAVAGLQDIEGVVGVEVWQVDTEISTIRTTERDIRGQQDQFPAGVLLVDLTDPSIAEAVQARLPLLSAIANTEVLHLTYTVGRGRAHPAATPLI